MYPDLPYEITQQSRFRVSHLHVTSVDVLTRFFLDMCITPSTRALLPAIYRELPMLSRAMRIPIRG
jgi:sulfur relay (sulfurtransferase) DsrC/TusE family protein